jgi:hypothetical protein
MPTELDEDYAFINRSVARKALHNLLEAKIHPHFAGYLALCRTARNAGSKKDLKFRAKGFFETFLRVADLPVQTPFVLPFRWGLGRGAPFFNDNVAGSYAPSSLREAAPFRQVARLAGSGSSTTYSLIERHAEAAKKRLTFDQQVDVASLSMFLYRDFGISKDVASPTGVVGLFRDEFGFRPEELDETEAFSVLFREDYAQFDTWTSVFDDGKFPDELT